MRPVTSETATSRLHRAPDGRDRAVGDLVVVADDRAVDIERDEADREIGSGVTGRVAGSNDVPTVASVTPTPAACADARQAGQVADRPRTSSPAAAPRRARRGLTLVGADLEQCHALGGEAPRQLVEQPPDDRQPVRSPVEGQPRLEGRADGPGRERVELGGPDVRQVREHDVERLRPRVGRQQVARLEREAVADPVGDRVLPGQVERVGRHVDGGDRDVVGRHAPRAKGDRQGHRDRAAPGADVDDAQRPDSVEPRR